MKNFNSTSTSTLVTIALFIATIFSTLNAQDCNRVTSSCSEVSLEIEHLQGDQVYQYTFTVSIPALCDMQQAVSHVSFGLPEGTQAANIEEEDVIMSNFTGTEYEVENTTNNPFYAIKFNVMDGYEGIKRGEREVFVFQLDDAMGVITEFPVEVKIANNVWIADLLVDVDCVPEQLTLPVELVSFKGQAEEKANELTWATASEDNNIGFSILHSTDGKNFDEIGWVDGAGNSNTAIAYNFSDFNYASGVNYYQLLQIDYDGTKNFSKVISIENKRITEISVFPNPVSDVCYVKMNADARDIEFTLMSSNGRMIRTWNVESAQESRGAIEMNDLAAGMYFLTARSGNNVQKIQIVKTK